MRPAYRVKRQFYAMLEPATALEVEDGFALGRKLKLWEHRRELEDEAGDDPLRPRSRFVDFVEAMAGELMIEPRQAGGRIHSTLIFESASDADDFVACLAGGAR